MTQSQHLQLGYIAKAHGTRGEVLVRTFDPASEALFEVDRIWVRRRDGTEAEMVIDDVRETSKDVLLTLEGVRSRSDSEALVGSTVFVFREDLEPPAEGEFFQGDLIGLKAFTLEGTEVGTVEELWSTGEVPTLVIRKGADELLLPFADDFVDTVDIAAGRLVVKPPELTE